MNRPPFLLLALASMVVAPLGIRAAEPERKPNILFILADDVTYSMIGCYGGVDAKTPHIDTLAEEGMRFTRAYCATAMCAPFRSELYTGMYPVRNGAAWNHSSVRPGTKSAVHYLNEEGYRVGLAGKKHVSPGSSFPFVPVKGLLAGDGVRRFMTQDEQQPFCLFLCSHNGHAPWTTGDSGQFDQSEITLAPTQHDNPQTREVMSRYLAEVEDLDREVGEILDLLDETGQRENTLVMFSSEQGWALGFAKWTNWDLGVHTSLVARWPGKIKAGRVSNALIHMADIVPTLRAVAGAERKPALFDGRSFYRHLLGRKQPMRKYVYGVHNNVPEGNPYPIRSVRDNAFHYINNLTPEVPYHEKHVMVKDSRLIWWPALKEAEAKNDTRAITLLKKFHARPAEELYKVDEDPYETNNLAADPSYAAIKARLHAELTRWMNQQNDPGAALDSASAYAANRAAGGKKNQSGKKKKQSPKK